MRLFIDECLSPALARLLNQSGEPDAIHPLDVGRRGAPDHVVVQRCLSEDRVIVTENARDFRALLAGAELHPGLIILPAIDREGHVAAPVQGDRFSDCARRSDEDNGQSCRRNRSA